jgi:hypothetical protein
MRTIQAGHARYCSQVFFLNLQETLGVGTRPFAGRAFELRSRNCRVQPHFQAFKRIIRSANRQLALADLQSELQVEDYESLVCD